MHIGTMPHIKGRKKTFGCASPAQPSTRTQSSRIAANVDRPEGKDREEAKEVYIAKEAKAATKRYVGDGGDDGEAENEHGDDMEDEDDWWGEEEHEERGEEEDVPEVEDEKDKSIRKQRQELMRNIRVLEENGMESRPRSSATSWWRCPKSTVFGSGRIARRCMRRS